MVYAFMLIITIILALVFNKIYIGSSDTRVGCGWNTCRYNIDGICACKLIDLNVRVEDDDREYLICSKFKRG